MPLSHQIGACLAAVRLKNQEFVTGAFVMLRSLDHVSGQNICCGFGSFEVFWTSCSPAWQCLPICALLRGAIAVSAWTFCTSEACFFTPHSQAYFGVSYPIAKQASFYHSISGSSTRADLSPRPQPLIEASSARVRRPTMRGTSSRSRASSSVVQSTSAAADRDAKRRQRALEKQFSKATRRAEANRSPPALALETLSSFTAWFSCHSRGDPNLVP